MGGKPCAEGTATKWASTHRTACAMSARKKVPMPDHREIRQWDWALKAAWRVTNEESYMEHSVNSLTRAVACLLRRERARAALELESLRNIAHAVGNKLNEGATFDSWPELREAFEQWAGAPRGNK